MATQRRLAKTKQFFMIFDTGYRGYIHIYNNNDFAYTVCNNISYVHVYCVMMNTCIYKYIYIQLEVSVGNLLT